MSYIAHLHVFVGAMFSMADKAHTQNVFLHRLIFFFYAGVLLVSKFYTSETERNQLNRSSSVHDKQHLQLSCTHNFPDSWTWT